MELSSYNNFNISSDDFNSSSNESTTSCVPTNMDDFTSSTSNTTSIVHDAQPQRFGFVNSVQLERFSRLVHAYKYQKHFKMVLIQLQENTSLVLP